MLMYLPRRHDIMCDFLLPYKPQINAENGIFVLRKTLGSLFTVISNSSVGQMLPKSPYCGSSFES